MRSTPVHVYSDDQEVKDGGASNGEGAAPASPRVEVVDMTGEDEGSSDEAAFEPTIMHASVRPATLGPFLVFS